MRILLVFSLSVVLSVVTGWRAKAQTADNPLAAAPTEYSVELLVTPKSGSPTIMRMFIDGQMRRTEQQTHNGELIVILRGDLNKMYTVLTARKAYRESPADSNLVKSLDISQLAKEIGIAHEKVGNEYIDGEPCDKYRFSVNAGASEGAGALQANSGFVWISQSTHLPVKSETAGATTIWKVLNVGPQDPSLFMPPVDFQRVD
jgi:hypothetical protein